MIDQRMTRKRNMSLVKLRKTRVSFTNTSCLALTLKADDVKDCIRMPSTFSHFIFQALWKEKVRNYRVCLLILRIS